jgi:GNAT superfamily N-acetyltransferase
MAVSTDRDIARNAELVCRRYYEIPEFEDTPPHLYDIEAKAREAVKQTGYFLTMYTSGFIACYNRAIPGKGGRPQPYIWLLGVYPGCRGTGAAAVFIKKYARELKNHIEDWKAWDLGITTLWTHTWVGAPAMMRTLEKLGFVRHDAGDMPADKDGVVHKKYRYELDLLG